jgi:hypothetical protein
MMGGGEGRLQSAKFDGKPYQERKQYSLALMFREKAYLFTSFLKFLNL